MPAAGLRGRSFAVPAPGPSAGTQGGPDAAATAAWQDLLAHAAAPLQTDPAPASGGLSAMPGFPDLLDLPGIVGLPDLSVSLVDGSADLTGESMPQGGETAVAMPDLNGSLPSPAGPDWFAVGLPRIPGPPEGWPQETLVSSAEPAPPPGPDPSKDDDSDRHPVAPAVVVPIAAHLGPPPVPPGLEPKLPIPVAPTPVPEAWTISAPQQLVRSASGIALAKAATSASTPAAPPRFTVSRPWERPSKEQASREPPASPRGEAVPSPRPAESPAEPRLPAPDPGANTVLGPPTGPRDPLVGTPSVAAGPRDPATGGTSPGTAPLRDPDPLPPAHIRLVAPKRARLAVSLDDGSRVEARVRVEERRIEVQFRAPPEAAAALRLGQAELRDALGHRAMDLSHFEVADSTTGDREDGAEAPWEFEDRHADDAAPVVETPEDRPSIQDDRGALLARTI